jgi:hypothetical protein
MIKVSLFIILFTTLMGAIAALLCSVTGGLTTGHASWALTLSLILSFIAVRKQFQNKKLVLQKLSVFDFLMFFCFFVFCFRQFAWIYFQRDGSFFTLDVNNIGDLPLHLTFIEQIARGVKLLSLNPIYPYEKLHYPIGSDLITACFLKIGLTLDRVLPLMGLILSVSLGWALFLWSRGFALGAFLFSGGLGGFEIFSTHILKDYHASLAWKNIVLTLLVPQRGFLIAFPAGLWLLWSWREKFFYKKSGLNLFIEGVLYGTLPFFHFHTFIFLSALLLVFTLASRNIKVGSKIVAAGLIPGTYFTLLITENFRQSSLIWIEKGWWIKDQNIIGFFLTNYGLFFPLVFLSFFIALKQPRQKYFEVVSIIAGLSFFTVCLFVMFAPWDWDNTKLMVWCYILMLPAIDAMTILPLPIAGRIVAYAVFFFSGAVSLLSSYTPANPGYALGSQAELEQVCSIVKKLDPLSIFATAPTFGHPVSLCGGPIAAGYEGHLWSYGIKSEKVVSALKRFMLGQDDYKKIAGDLQIRYVFWGSREVKEYPGSPLPELLIDKSIAEGNWGKIFDLLKDVK